MKFCLSITGEQEEAITRDLLPWHACVLPQREQPKMSPNVSFQFSNSPQQACPYTPGTQDFCSDGLKCLFFP